MPWLEATPMEQRERFIRDQQNGLYTMTELCDRHTLVGRRAINGSIGSTRAVAQRSGIAAARHTSARIGSPAMSPT